VLPEPALNVLVQQAQTMRDAGSSYDEIMTNLRGRQVSIIDTARVLRRIRGLDYALVKSIIDESPVWSDLLQENANVRTQVMDLVTESDGDGNESLDR